jgi:hypothetical protein
MLDRLSNGWMLDLDVEWKHGAGGMLVGLAPMLPAAQVTPFQDAFLANIRLKF